MARIHRTAITDLCYSPPPCYGKNLARTLMYVCIGHSVCKINVLSVDFYMCVQYSMHMCVAVCFVVV